MVLAAELLSDELRVLEDPAPPEMIKFDLVLAIDPTGQDLQRATRVLASGGHIYVELSRRFGSSARRSRGTLERLGFRELRSYWHFPAFAPSRAIVPLDDRAAYSYALSRRESAPIDRFQAWAASRLGPALVAATASSRSIIGALSDTEAGSGGRTFVAAATERYQLERYGRTLSEVVITPVAETSKNVVVLLLAPETLEPTLVAKCPRLGERGGLEREAESLRALRQDWPNATAATPELIALEEHDGVPILLQTAVRGHGLEPAELRRSHSETVPAVVATLADLASATACKPARYDDWHTRLLRRPLEDFAETVVLDGDERDLVRRTLELVEPLREAAVPLVCEHGDVAHSNVLRLESGRIGIVDWELAERQGLPLSDLCFFLAYAGFARWHALDAVERLAAFDQAFFRADGWAKVLIASSAARLELPPASLTPLFVASWARYTARLPVWLLAPAGAEVLPPQTRLTAAHPAADEVRPWLTLWRYAVDHAPSISWPPHRGKRR